MQRRSEEFEKIRILGKGAFGTVYLEKDLALSKNVAIKEYDKRLFKHDLHRTILSEITCLTSLQEHPNIVKIEGVVNEPQKFKIVMEYIDKNLNEYQKEKCEQNESLCTTPMKIKNIMFQLLQGVQYIHFNRIIHRDLKPENCL